MIFPCLQINKKKNPFARAYNFMKFQVNSHHVNSFKVGLEPEAGSFHDSIYSW